MFRLHLGALALAAVCVLPLAASAQTAPAPGTFAPPRAAQQQGPHHRGPSLRMMRGLNLSDAQRRQIDGILQNSRRQIDAVLTPDQRAQLRARLSQARQRRAQPGAPVPQAPQQ